MATRVEHYSNGERIEGLIDQLTTEWFTFRKLIPISDKLVSLAKELNVKGISSLTKGQREAYPSNIEFLGYPSIEKAVDYIYDLSPKKMEDLLREINKEKKEGIFYNAMSEWIKNARRKIRSAKKPKCYVYESKDKSKAYEKVVKEKIDFIEEQVLIEIKTTFPPGEA